MEYVGFIISLLALLFLFLNSKKEEKRKHGRHHSHPKVSVEEESYMQDFMRALEREQVREEKLRKPHQPRPPKAPKKDKHKVKELPQPTREWESDLAERRLQSRLEERRLRSALATRHAELGGPDALHLQEYKVHAPARGRAAIQRLSRLSDMVIYQEILGKPKALRPEP